MDWKATSYPRREKTFHKEYSGKNDWLKDNVCGEGGGWEGIIRKRDQSTGLRLLQKYHF